jgi:hypothetical protein
MEKLNEKMHERSSFLGMSWSVLDFADSFNMIVNWFSKIGCTFSLTKDDRLPLKLRSFYI